MTTQWSDFPCFLYRMPLRMSSDFISLKSENHSPVKHPRTNRSRKRLHSECSDKYALCRARISGTVR